MTITIESIRSRPIWEGPHAVDRVVDHPRAFEHLSALFEYDPDVQTILLVGQDRSAANGPYVRSRDGWCRPEWWLRWMPEEPTTMQWYARKWWRLALAVRPSRLDAYDADGRWTHVFGPLWWCTRGTQSSTW
jgi:hypothetical protein